RSDTAYPQEVEIGLFYSTYPRENKKTSVHFVPLFAYAKPKIEELAPLSSLLGIKHRNLLSFSAPLFFAY
ncbi:hypothetical protein REH81_34330, partial [Vibrio rotiferianus]